MLDDKLKDILIGVESAFIKDTYDFNSIPNAIAQIKQVFADEGWTHKPFLKHLTQTDDTPVYTGQEWYERFVHELKAFYTELDIPEQEAALMAAKKASGIN